MNAIKTPQGRASAFWRRRALRPADRWILAHVEDYRVAILADLPDATAAEQRTVELAAVARGCTMLLLAGTAAMPGGLLADGYSITAPSAKDAAVTIKRTRPDHLAALARFMATEAKLLALVGMKRRARPVGSLAEFVEAQARAVRGES